MPKIAVVDYGMGNLFSVSQACIKVGLHPVITSASEDLIQADGVVLPGVGAFKDAMRALRQLDLVGTLMDVARSSKPFLGVCLGMQLMMTESSEFGVSKGLGIIDGVVERLTNGSNCGYIYKVPQVGWNRIYKSNTDNLDNGVDLDWKSPLLHGIRDGEYMYFVHSFYAKPEDSDVIVSTTQYGETEFCSFLTKKNVVACQFHPERSGRSGLRIYENFGTLISTSQGSLRS